MIIGVQMKMVMKFVDIAIINIPPTPVCQTVHQVVVHLLVDKVMAVVVHVQVGIREFGGRGAPAVQVAEEEYKPGQMPVEIYKDKLATPNPVKVHGGR